MTIIKDQLSWEEFYRVSKKLKSNPKKISAFNRLIAHSKNFFIISGYGAFTPGYSLIITKDFIPSYGLIEKDKLEELNFIISLIKEINQQSFDRSSVIFEHGMCACIGGLDRAHLHIMTLDQKSSEASLVKSINTTLYNRKVGIDHVEYNNYKLENIHDINHFFENSNKNNKDFKIVGKILELKDIQNLNENEWPLITIKHINKGGHYVFFKSEFKKAAFLTTKNFQTQFGREVIFLNELNLNSKFKKQINEIKKNNEHMEVWKWQNCMFEENIIKTMKITKKMMKKLYKKFDENYDKFEIEVI